MKRSFWSPLVIWIICSTILNLVLWKECGRQKNRTDQLYDEMRLNSDEQDYRRYVKDREDNTAEGQVCALKATVFELAGHSDEAQPLVDQAVENFLKDHDVIELDLWQLPQPIWTLVGPDYLVEMVERDRVRLERKEWRRDPSPGYGEVGSIIINDVVKYKNLIAQNPDGGIWVMGMGNQKLEIKHLIWGNSDSTVWSIIRLGQMSLRNVRAIVLANGRTYEFNNWETPYLAVKQGQLYRLFYVKGIVWGELVGTL